MRIKQMLIATVLSAGLMICSNSEVEALRYFGQTPEMMSSLTPYGDNAKVAHYVKAEDAKIYYEVYGQGEPVVILHGGGLGCSYEMGCFIDELKGSHQVIVISTRGHGKSEIGEAPFTLKQRADDIQFVLKDVGIDQAVKIIGFSDGGYSAYSFAVNYPSSVKKLVAIGAGEVLPTNKFFIFRLADWYRFDEDFCDQQGKLMPEPERWQEMLRMYEKMWNGAIISKETFSEVTCPVLVVNGEKDPNSPMSTAIAAYYELPDAHLSIIPNAGHACFLENFDAVWAVVEPFIND